MPRSRNYFFVDEKRNLPGLRSRTGTSHRQQPLPATTATGTGTGTAATATPTVNLSTPSLSLTYTCVLNSERHPPRRSARPAPATTAAQA